MKYFTPKAKTVNFALSLLSAKFKKFFLYTHVVSQVFIRSHNRCFSLAVNEKPFNIVITWGELLSLCHPTGISHWVSIGCGQWGGCLQCSVIGRPNLSFALWYFSCLGKSQERVIFKSAIFRVLGVLPLKRSDCLGVTHTRNSFQILKSIFLSEKAMWKTLRMHYYKL